MKLPSASLWAAFAVGLFCSFAFRVIGQEVSVVEVKVIGLERVSEEFVLSRLGTRVGAPWDSEIAARDYTRLYATDRFLKVAIETENVPGGLQVLIYVTEAPLVTHIRFEGLDHLSYRDMISGMEEFGLEGLPQDEVTYYGRPLSDGLKRDLIRGAKEAARKKNFSDFDLVATLESNEYGEGVTLVLKAAEANKVYVDDFKIRSESGFSERFIKRNTRLFTQEKFWIFKSGVFDPEILSDDILQIVYMFRDRGYLDVTVDATVGRETVEPGWLKGLFNSPNEDRLSIDLTVREGPLYSIGDITLSGVNLFTKEEVLEAFAIRSGDILDNQKLNKAQERLEELYGSKGYIPEGTFPDPVLTRIYVRQLADARTRTVDLEIVVREGQPITIRDLIIRGNEKTRDEVIRREMLGVLPGSLYQWSEQKEALRRLKNLDYFKNETGVDLQVSPEVGQTQRDLILNVEEDQTGGFSFGFAVTSEGDVNANVSLNQSNFDVTDVAGFPFNAADFFRNRQYVGKGQNLSLLVSPGTQRSSYSASLFEPWFMGHPWGVGVSGALVEDTFSDYDQERSSLALTVSRRWYPQPQELITAGVRLRREEVVLDNVEFDAPSFILDSDLNTTINSFMPFVSYDSRDSARYPSEGQLHELSVELAGGFLGGLDFVRTSQRSVFYHTVWTDREDEDHVMSFSTKFDWIEPYRNTSEIPISERVFLGGLDTLRGYKFGAIGPQDNGFEIGGTVRHHGSIEYLVPLAGRTFRGVAFFDYGALHPVTPGRWINNYRFSVGVGVRLVIPGLNFPVRIEMAEPVGPKSNHQERQFVNFAFSAKTSF